MWVVNCYMLCSENYKVLNPQRFCVITILNSMVINKFKESLKIMRIIWLKKKIGWFELAP